MTIARRAAGTDCRALVVCARDDDDWAVTVVVDTRVTVAVASVRLYGLVVDGDELAEPELTASVVDAAPPVEDAAPLSSDEDAALPPEVVDSLVMVVETSPEEDSAVLDPEIIVVETTMAPDESVVVIVELIAIVAAAELSVELEDGDVFEDTVEAAVEDVVEGDVESVDTIDDVEVPVVLVLAPGARTPGELLGRTSLNVGPGSVDVRSAVSVGVAEVTVAVGVSHELAGTSLSCALTVGSVSR